LLFGHHEGSGELAAGGVRGRGGELDYATEENLLRWM
jgi:hypothetical protein